jgi:hypothetical protein
LVVSYGSAVILSNLFTTWRFEEQIKAGKRKKDCKYRLVIALVHTAFAAIIVYRIWITK